MNDYPPLPRWKTILGCHHGYTYWRYGDFDHSKVVSHLLCRLCHRIETIRQSPMNFRHWLAGWLCRTAVWLRGGKWYVSKSWYGVPGNRASELRQLIWVDTVCLADCSIEEDKEKLDAIDRNLTELSQAAGEAWGHIEP